VVCLPTQRLHLLSATNGSAALNKQAKKKIVRQAIQASVAAFDAPYQIKVFPKPEEARRLIYDALFPNLLFRACSSEELYELVDVFRPRRCPKHVDIIREGTEGDGFYVMEKGQVDVYERDAYKCSLQRGHGFGEIALLYSCPRTATVRAKEECELWFLDRQAFREITARHKRNRLNMKMSLLAKVCACLYYSWEFVLLSFVMSLYYNINTNYVLLTNNRFLSFISGEN
jgi:hypothetical protein